MKHLFIIIVSLMLISCLGDDNNTYLHNCECVVTIDSVSTTSAKFYAYDTSSKTNKVTICHVLGNGKTKTIEVDENAVQAHLNHGDSLGACDTDSEGDGSEGDGNNDNESDNNDGDNNDEGSEGDDSDNESDNSGSDDDNNNDESDNSTGSNSSNCDTESTQPYPRVKIYSCKNDALLGEVMRKVDSINKVRNMSADMWMDCN